MAHFELSLVGDASPEDVQEVFEQAVRALRAVAEGVIEGGFVTDELALEAGDVEDVDPADLEGESPDGSDELGEDEAAEEPSPEATEGS